MVSEVDTSRIPSALPKSAELLPLSVRVHLRSDPTGLCHCLLRDARQISSCIQVMYSAFHFYSPSLHDWRPVSVRTLKTELSIGSAA